jgi:hypothetical protein
MGVGLMKVLMVVASVCLLAACGGEQGSETSGQGSVDTTTSTSTVVASGAATTTTTTTTAVAVGDTSVPGGRGTVVEGYCATGTYDLDGAALWADVAAASGEGGSGEVVSGAVVLDLRADLTAVIDYQSWTFRLRFPGQGETVLGVQTGQLTGTWSVDDQGAHTIDLVTDTVEATFVLETAQGSVPVPAGQKLAPLGTFDLLADCRSPDVALVADDVALGATIEWSFVRRDT